jgi:hypothetical protein
MESYIERPSVKRPQRAARSRSIGDSRAYIADDFISTTVGSGGKREVIHTWIDRLRERWVKGVVTPRGVEDLRVSRRQGQEVGNCY